MTPEIKLTDGELREENTILLSVDFSGDSISSLYTNKRWTVFSEKNVKWDTFLQDYYFEDNEGVIFEAQNSNDILITNLVIGRLFCRFQYTDLQGNDYDLKAVFKVLPNYTIDFPTDIKEGIETTFEVVTNLEGLSTTYDFSHDGSSVTTSGAHDITITDHGYHRLDTTLDWAEVEYTDGVEVIWDSTPDDVLVGTGGYFGNGTKANETTTETISANYLVKRNLEQYINLDMKLTESINNTVEAPLFGFVEDNSTYGYTFDGDDAIEYTELDYGDGVIERTYEILFNRKKLFKQSGEYKVTYTVFTKHVLPEITYRQSISVSQQISVDSFFGTFFRGLFNNLYVSQGFHDLTSSWGLQMDRLYKETQDLIKSLDSSTMADKILPSFAGTYGDFDEIYEKVGYKALSEAYGDDERFDYFSQYNFFDRVKAGDLTPKEKQDFISYIRDSKNRLSGKGTSETLERIFAFFALSAHVKELWFRPQTKKDKTFTDEVFDGNQTLNMTGLTPKRVSLPGSDNEDNFISDRIDNPYIEINSFDNVSNTFYTENTETEIINGKEYVKISI